MTAAEAQSEPTMEEILASIRKIISDDDVKPEDELTSDGTFDEVLDLSQVEPEPEPIVDDHVAADFDFDNLDIAAPEPAVQEFAPVEEFEVDEIIAVEHDPVPEPQSFFEPEPIVEKPIIEPPVAAAPKVVEAPRQTFFPPHLAETVGLIGAGTETAATEAFKRLGSALPNHFATGASVEELVAYLLKPMLKDWLDNNLPRIVEERVEAELARIARRGFKNFSF